MWPQSPTLSTATVPSAWICITVMLACAMKNLIQAVLGNCKILKKKPQNARGNSSPMDGSCRIRVTYFWRSEANSHVCQTDDFLQLSIVTVWLLGDQRLWTQTKTMYSVIYIPKNKISENISVSDEYLPGFLGGRFVCSVEILSESCFYSWTIHEIILTIRKKSKPLQLTMRQTTVKTK